MHIFEKKSMKFLLSLIVLLSTNAFAQLKNETTNYKIVLGTIKQKGGGKPSWGPISDSVIVENDIKFATKVIALMKDINKNGVDDVSKCFIPRHTILVYKNNVQVYRLLVCFECEGFRLYDNKETENGFCKSYKKRLLQLDKVRSLFAEKITKKEAPKVEVTPATN
jgi:hypothetical protein